MYLVDKYTIKLCIDLDSGIYVFDPESATGKTRLCGLLHKYQAYGEPVLSYTSDDYVIGLTISDLLKGKSCKVLMLDRYDRYAGAFEKEINELAKTSIILIDCKGELHIDCDFKNCSIKMEEKSIEVF